MSRTAVLTISPEGVVRGLWNDALPFRELGKPEVNRASNVEFNAATGEWEAITPDGRLLAHGPERSKVIDGEIAALQAEM